MFDKDFFQRLSFQQICEFICTGDFLYPENVDEGTLTQRAERYEREQGEALRSALERMYDAGRRGMGENEKEKFIEDLGDEIFSIDWKAERLSFEAGFVAGLWVGGSLGRIV